MHMLIAFAVLFVLAFCLITLLEGYAAHMGNPETTNWLGVAGLALVVAFIGALIFGGIWALLAPLLGG